MSIQLVIDTCQGIEIDRRKIVGQSMSRSQRVKSAERASANPWRFKVTPASYFKYSTARGMLESINATDKVAETEIKLSNNTKTEYLTAYQGELTQSELDSILVTAFTGTTLTLGNLPAALPTKVLFKPGDYIQPINSRYPYTVVNTVLRGTTSTVQVTTHRPVIASESVDLTDNIKVGKNVTWRVLVASLPTHQLVSNNLVQFTGDFELIEKIT
jgi:hypothetical protein